MRRILAAALVASVASGCGLLSTGAQAVADGAGQEITSAEGYVAGLIEDTHDDGDLTLVPVVYDVDGDVIFTDSDHYAHQGDVSLFWHPSEHGHGDELWVVSFAQGVARIVNTDGVWVKAWPQRDDLPAPVLDFLDG